MMNLKTNNKTMTATSKATTKISGNKCTTKTTAVH